MTHEVDGRPVYSGRMRTLDHVTDEIVTANVSPPRSPAVTGNLIEWLPPARGDDPSYVVIIYRLEAVDPSVVSRVALSARTDETSFLIPSGVLVAGAEHVVEIRASVGSVDDHGWATSVTGRFVPLP